MQPNISQQFTKEETEDADKDRIDIVLETDPIVENEVRDQNSNNYSDRSYRPRNGDIRQTIGTMIDLIIEGKVLIKIMAKKIETEV